MATQNIYALTDTWNAGATTFTGIGLNVTDTASAAGSALMDLQVGGVSQFKVSKAGAVTAVGVAIPTISSTDTLTNKTLSSPTLSGTVSGTPTFSGTITSTASDAIILQSDTANIQFKEGGGTGRWIFGIRTDITGNDSDIVFFAAGVGTAVQIVPSTRVVDFKVTPTLNAVAIPTISSTDTLTNKTLTSPVFTNTTVAGLPAAATAGSGARAFVTDALAPVFGSAVAGSGAVKVPVYSDGAAWNVG